MIRHEYLVTRDGFHPSDRTIPVDLEVRAPGPEDRPELASLMMDAYLGTIDYEGETYEQAVEEVDGYLAKGALLAASLVAIGEGVVQSAVLVSGFDEKAIIGYLMTRAAVKNRGLASALLDRSLETLWFAGHQEVQAFITRGNGPSEQIFTRAGFEVVGTFDDGRDTPAGG